MFSPLDHQHMARALQLAKRGEFTTAPNPNVGCVIAHGNQIVGEGAHLKSGEPHAEVHALAMAKEQAKGATAYVTLEPCSHYGRTPPCANALIKAGVSRVVAAMVDPNPKVAGRGLSMLEEAGVTVESGLMQAQAEALNVGFIKRMKTDRPFVQLKMAASLDGQTALENGESQWITGSAARADVQRFRAKSAAILSASGTVLADNPSLNVRWSQLPESVKVNYSEEELRIPTRVIIDSQNRVTSDYQLLSLAGKTILVGTQARDDIESLGDSSLKNVTQLVVAEKDGRVDLVSLMDQLGELGINNLWIEAGAELSGALFDAQLVDQVILYIAPKLMGSTGRGVLDLAAMHSMTEVPELKIDDLRQIGDDIRIIATPQGNEH
ncbi:bifunctional diaminohydroxyphosphoribosylaminopyrimidine deaminase/5-amino-6-(5-phosphoribosylamino)uracil reductase RibD [Vibrio sp. SS-MA-C1-2]|uniref:bifunctional diaminohydroxyphosphoribosylaminopyrimidine deaminase/5-amino-6-(5-phosphoribosylamino)uracil reductase RibD n=1 Tax=Vibrio sp. SS-MA-C1-2 TaxID=2908646 RepID=UPI001F01A3BB|nr:bifunctional diaminohydroxyphosphoribosylaminopyrimidine deaminase/5-amino-6-(5-phosphoribosylamino)uracil reductase RibD [Vibrio sp. SS-MA-C1-2]UJF18857.1 bifunctional diaminohydroxyphosphoribosylaminopyrimidine deaminase/5-amino-6-(5-phosphoribosylamino)uracil reductase RibD [Vibrio sp. SS-MA-C1-2]